MTSYLACMKKVRGVNKDECRDLAKAYLSCRMDKYVFLSSLLFTLALTGSSNLMARDEFKNLGFADPSKETTTPAPGKDAEKGVKGELHW